MNCQKSNCPLREIEEKLINVYLTPGEKILQDEVQREKKGETSN